MNIEDRFLESGEWLNEKQPKDKIFIHHTAGGYRPDWTIAGWNRDRSQGRRRRVATAYVVGGLSTRSADDSWDGRVLRAFPEDEWAYHLGLKGSRGRFDRSSVGIELCNFGYLRATPEGTFLTYVNSVVPESQVVELNSSFRGHQYYHKYSDRQLESLSALLRELATRFDIDLTRGLQESRAREALRVPDGPDLLETQRWLNQHGFLGKTGQPLTEDGIDGANTRWAKQSVGQSAFELNSQALTGQPGLWTHTNVRKDKFDCSPQPLLLQMIDSLD